MKAVNKVYDQYQEQDYTYGSDNLNPVREITLDNIDRVSNRIQEITEAILKKRLQPKTDEDQSVDIALNGEKSSNQMTIDERIRLLRTGTSTDSMFPQISGYLGNALNSFILSLPEDLRNEIEGPIKLECETILQQYNFVDTSEELEEALASIKEGMKDDDENDDETDEDDSEEEEEGDDDNDPVPPIPKPKGPTTEDCEEMELWYLKYLLVLAKVLKVLRIIIDLVFSIVSPLLQMVSWAVGAWLDPPNIACISQYLVELITSLIVMLMGMLLKAIWDLLNLDCLTSQTEKTIAEVRKALGSVNSALGKINPGAVNLLSNRVSNEVLDPIQIILDQIGNKADQWAQFQKDLADMLEPDNVSEQLKQMKDDIVDDVINGTMNLNEAKKVERIVKQAKRLYKNEIKGIAKNAQGVYDMYKASKNIVLQPSTIKETASYKLLGSKIKSLKITRAPKEEE